MSATFIQSPLNLIRARLATGDESAPMFDRNLLRDAEEVVASMKDRFVDWAETHIVELESHVEAVRVPGEDWEQRIAQVWRSSFEIAGLAGTFDYGLLTAIAESMCRIVDSKTELTPQAFEILVVHMNALKLVIGQRLSGDGGEAGARLMNNLHKAAAKAA